VSFRIDTGSGIEFRAVLHHARGGWTIQWRPARAIKAFPSFSYRTIERRFETEADALEFLDANTGRIVSGLDLTIS